MSAFKSFLLRYGILLIILIGFALRVALVVQGQDLPVKWDEGAYVKRAHDILENLAKYRDVMRAPLYPFFLAGIYQLIGDLRYVVGIIQALISTFLIAVIYTLSRLLFGRNQTARRDETTPPGNSAPSGTIAGRADSALRGPYALRDYIALGAALITALYLEFLTLTRVLMSETLFIVLSVFGMTILFHAWKKDRTWEFIAAGALLALAALTRELLSYFAVLVLPVWVILVFLRQPRRLLLNLAALLFGLALVFTPWVVRNYGIEQRFVLSTIHSEIDLLRDNWRIEMKAQGLPLRNAEGSIKKRVRKALAGIPRSERSTFALTNAVATIAYYPREWLRDKTTRLRNLWRPFSLEARVVRLENIRQPWRGTLSQIVSYSAVLILLLGTVGLLTSRDDAPKLLIALYILYSLVIFLITHYLPRFRLPLLILMIPYAAFAVAQIILWLRAPTSAPIKQHPWRAASTAIVLVLFVYLAMN